MRAAFLLGLLLGLGAFGLAWSSRRLSGVPSSEPVREAGARQDAAPQLDAVAELRARSLLIPVLGRTGEDLRDSFDEARRGHTHEAIDILAPRGTPVIAVDDGRVRLARSSLGGLTASQLDATGRYCFYYAHLDGYALGLSDGQQVRKGQTLGYVGTTGNAPRQTPHLHFAAYRVDEDEGCSDGTPVNPFAIWVAAAPRATAAPGT